MKDLIEIIALAFLRGTCALVAALPVEVSVRFFEVLLRFVVPLSSKYRNVALKNLQIAFPGKSDEERQEVFRKSFSHLARVFVDFCRLPRLGPDWVLRHVECSLLDRYKQIKQENPERGIVLATGHLGSFELLAHCMPMFGHPISFVVRNFKMKRLDYWWTKAREAYGNKVLSRRGAFALATKELSSGRDVAILFDQNVTIKHAVFVDWFGIKAATSKLPAIAALRGESPVIVASIEYVGSDRYRINAVECDFSALYKSQDFSSDEKIEKITACISQEYEKMIRAQPEAWFWLHRRFRTRPLGEDRIY